MPSDDIFAPQDDTGGAGNVAPNPNPEVTPEQGNEQDANTLIGGAAGDATPSQPEPAPEPGQQTGENEIVYTDFVLPDGAQVDEAIMSNFKELAAQCGLNQESAQKMLDLQAKANEVSMEAFVNQRKEWRQAITNDADFGQANLKETVADANRVLAEYDESGNVLGMLEQSGFGDNPDVIKFLARVARAIPREDDVLTGKEVSADKRSLEERLWPD